jgi:hypothetical protein
MLREVGCAWTGQLHPLAHRGDSERRPRVPLKLSGKRGHERAAQGEVTREITKENVKSVDWLHAEADPVKGKDEQKKARLVLPGSP